jgi:filamentous hemagglutinin family protein
MVRLIKRTGFFVVGLLLIVRPCRAGNVASDGSLGAGAVVHQGNTFTVPRSAGRLVGSNLFQSLSTLNLDTGETANFTGPAQVSNVLTRVTGGPSTINGTLQCSIPNANFYLINPAGVVFGPDASLNVGGSFAVTTADVIHLADGGKFKANPAANSVLSTAAPAAFGFLNRTPTDLTFNGSNISTAAGQTLSVVGGDLSLANATMQAPGGVLSLVSVHSAGTVNVAGPASPPDVSSFNAMGELQASGVLSVDGGSDGRIFIRAGSATLNSTIAAHSGSPDSANSEAVVDIAVRGDLKLNGNIEAENSLVNPTHPGSVAISAGSFELNSTIDTSTFDISGAGGNGGSVAITIAGALKIDAGGINASSQSEFGGGGSGGAVTITAGSILMQHQASIQTDTSGPRAGGAVTITATNDVTLDNSNIILNTFGLGEPGDGGAFTLHAGSLHLLNGSQINCGTDEATGNAGNITIDVGSLTIDGETSSQATGVFSSATGGNVTGNAGNVLITANTATIENGGKISSDTSTNGLGGTVQLDIAGPLNLQGGFISASTSTDSSFGSGTIGTGGTVRVNAASLSISNGGSISSQTSGFCPAGAVRVTIQEDLSIDNGTISSEAVVTTDGLGAIAAFGQGNAGNVSIQTGTLELRNQGKISSDTFYDGAGGTVYVHANGNILLDNSTISSQTHLDPLSFYQSDPPLAEFVVGGAGGNVTVFGDSLQLQNSARISSNTLGNGAAGSVTISANSIMLNSGSEISSNSLLGISPGGHAGDVTVSTGSMSILDGGEIAASTFSTGAGGNVNVTVSGDLNLDNGDASNDSTAIAARSNLATPGGGRAGDVTVQAQTLSLLNGANIATSTFGTGKGGNVNIAVSGTMTLNSETSNFSGVEADSFLATSKGGKGGDITVSAGSLSILQTSDFAASTYSEADAGKINVTVNGPLLLDGGASGTSLATGIFTRSRLESPRKGGTGGDITINAQSLAMLYGAAINSGSVGSGAAGNVSITTSGPVTMGAGSDLGVSSTSGDGGSLDVSAGGDIELFDSTVRTNSGHDGGSITLSSPGIILLRNTPVTAQAHHNGGNITIDPELVILDNSPLTANAFTGAGGAISITASSGFLNFNSPISFTSTLGVPGSLTLFSPKLDIAAGLLVLPQPGFGGMLGLAPTCAQMTTGDVSSFILTGHGGLPIEPGGWLPVEQPLRNGSDSK